MSNVFKLVKLFLKLNIKREKGKSKGTALALIVSAVVFLPMVAVMCVVIGFLAGEAKRAGVLQELFATVASTSVIPVLFFGLFSVLNVIIFSKDNDFLASLPVPRVSIFVAKFVMVYLDEFLVSAVFLIPTSITLGVVTQASVIYYLALPVVTLLMPVFALVICTVLVFPVMYVIAFFRKHVTLATIMGVVVFGGIMALYFSVLSGAPMDDEVEITVFLTPQVIGLLKGIWTYFLPGRFASQLMVGPEFVVGGLLFLASAMLALGVAIAVAVPLHRRAVSLQSESRSGVKGKDIDMRQTSAIRAYIIRDFKQMLRFPAMAFQCFAGVLIVPVLTAVMPGTMKGELNAEMGVQLPNIIMAGIIMFYSLMLVSGTNYTASAAFTREGETFYYNKILPLSPRQIMMAKRIFANIVTLAAALLTTLSSVIFGGLNVLEGLGLFVCLTTFGAGMNAFGIKRDLARPKLKWANVNEALKNNFYMTVPMFIGMGAGIFLCVVSIVATVFWEVLGATIGNLIFWGVSILLCVVVGVFINGGYYAGCEENFERLEP